jgi:peptidoglycan/LPS O-acetylase OafA/YrhL
MYLPALTGLRGLAACWVLVLHLGEFSGSPPLAVPLGFASLDLTALAACGYLGDRSIL